jgi:hypothetical protein
MARGETQVGTSVSESETLNRAIALLSGIYPDHKPEQRMLAAAIDLLYGLKRQASMGIHQNARKKNPVLALFGNPHVREGEVLSRNVQAVLYMRADDGEPYAHGYGLQHDDDLKLATKRDGTACLGGLVEKTGMALVGMPNGMAVICDARMVDR